MTEAALPEETILLSVRTAPAEFSTSAQDLIALQKAGVSNTVIQTMITRNSAANVPAPGASAVPAVVAVPAVRPAVPSVPPMAPVAILDDRRILLVETPRVEKEEQGFNPVDEEVRTILPFETAELRLGSTVTFEVPLDGRRQRLVEYQVTLFKLESKNGRRQAVTETNFKDPDRVIGLGDAVATAAVTVLGGLARAKKAKKPGGLLPATVPITIEEISAIGSEGLKLYRVAPSEPLAPGEYLIRYLGDYYDFGVD